MDECVRNTIVVGGIVLIVAVRLAIDWIKSELQK